MSSPVEGGADVLVVLLYGIPGAGKSTVVGLARERLGDYDVSVVELDAELWGHIDSAPEVSHGGGTDWDPVLRDSWRAAREATECKVRELVVAHESTSPRHHRTRRVVFVDDNLQLRSMRKSFFRIARDCRVACVEVLLDTPQEVAVARNEARTGRAHIPTDVIQRLTDSLERGEPSDHSFVLDGTWDTEKLADTLSGIVRSSFHCVPPLKVDDAVAEAAKDTARAVTLSNPVQVVDVAVRKAVGAVCKAAPPSARRATAAAATAAKQTLLEAVRSGDVPADTEDLAAWATARFEALVKETLSTSE